MSSTTEPPESELLPEVYEAEPPPAPLTLFGTSDPRIALERMSDLAKVLVDLVRSQGLAVRISGREHLRVEAWRALGGMVGVHPITAWSRPNETGDGYVVRVEARTRAGELVGASEAECSRAESTWSRRDAYAIRPMAETRAVSRAMRGPLGQIVVLAGYEPAGAEELTAQAQPVVNVQPRQQSRPTLLQKQQMHAVFVQLADYGPGVDWAARCREVAGGPGDELTEAGAEAVLEQMRLWLHELGGEAASET